MLKVIIYLCFLILLIIVFEKCQIYFFKSQKKQNGRELQQFLSKIIHLSAVRPDHQIIPKYKFYTAIIEEILSLNQVMGGPKKKLLSSVRKALKDDLKMTEKLSQEKRSALAQFVIMTLVTWLFVFFSCHLTSAKPPHKILWLILVLQTTGFSLFYYYYQQNIKKRFSFFEPWLRTLFIFKSSLAVGAPLNTIQRRLGFLEEAPRDFFWLQKRFNESLKLCQSTGSPIHEELDVLIEETWILFDEVFSQFIKMLKALKIMIILIFFLLSYFLYLYALISTLTDF